MKINLIFYSNLLIILNDNYMCMDILIIIYNLYSIVGENYFNI